MATSAKGTNKFAIIISAIVVVAVAAVAVLVVWMNNIAATPAQAPAAASVNQETGAIAIGDGPNVVSEYVDFMCPFCGSYWAGYSGTVSEAVANGTTTLELHPISILDNASQGTQYSTRAAASVYSVASVNPDAVYTYVDLLYKNQPAEATEGLSNDQLISYATQAGAEGAADSINAGEYMDYVTQMTQETPIAAGASGISTPTILLNGEFVSLTGDPNTDLAAIITQ